MTEEYVSIPLDIPGIKVNGVNVTAEGEIHISVTSTRLLNLIVFT